MSGEPTVGPMATLTAPAAAKAAADRFRVTGGRGLVRSRDGQTVSMRPRDTVDSPSAPSGLSHWHDAAPDSVISHLALSGSGAGEYVVDVEWGDRVGDDEYTTVASGTRPEGARDDRG